MVWGGGGGVEVELVGEDASFCRRASSEGFDMWRIGSDMLEG